MGPVNDLTRPVNDKLIFKENETPATYVLIKPLSEVLSKFRVIFFYGINIEMTSVGSVGRSQRVVSLDNEFYIPVGNLTGLILSLNTTTNQLASTSWAYFGSRYLSSVNASGAGLLRDHGKTYLSGGRTFRKVQLVVPQSTGTQSTFGVGGATGTTPNQDFLTGYIEVGFDAASGTVPTPVAKWGR